MEYKDISKLLERYFEGETNLEEERQLRRYFMEGPVDEAHLPYQDLFQFFSHAQQTILERDIQEDLAVEPPSSHKSISRRIRIRPVFWRAAAAILIALSAWWLYPVSQESSQTAIDWSKYEPATPEDAFRITSAAFKSASKNLNSGAKQAAQEVSKVQKMKKVF